MESFEEASEAFKEFKESVIARAYSVSGLRSFEDQIRSTQPAKRHVL
jgi:hypothetical protein